MRADSREQRARWMITPSNHTFAVTMAWPQLTPWPLNSLSYHWLGLKRALPAGFYDGETERRWPRCNPWATLRSARLDRIDNAVVLKTLGCRKKQRIMTELYLLVCKMTQDGVGGDCSKIMFLVLFSHFSTDQSLSLTFTGEKNSNMWAHNGNQRRVKSTYTKGTLSFHIKR